VIVHEVLFRLRRPTEDAARAGFAEALRRFADDPPFAVGPATVQESLLLRGESPRAADALLAVTFSGREEFARYLASDAHQALLRDTLEPMCEGWWSVQFEA
jgi:stress responsive alpha/beta barrel protein